MSSLKLTQEELFAKSLVRLAIHKMGTARAASEWTGILESELSRFASDNTDRHIPFHLMMKLNAAADNAVTPWRCLGLGQIARGLASASCCTQD